MEQAVINLLKNAHEAGGAPGSVELLVAATARSSTSRFATGAAE
jgi:hypothetical protein